jgi:ribonuclease Z
MIRMMMLSAIVALCLNGESAASQVVREKHRNSTVVILLGTGTPVPDPSAMVPATLVVYGDREFLFDAGVGVERQLAKAKLSFVNIEAVFLTHLHSDHILGLPDVIFTSWIFGRHTPLKVYGPYGTTNMRAQRTTRSKARTGCGTGSSRGSGFDPHRSDRN